MPVSSSLHMSDRFLSPGKAEHARWPHLRLSFINPEAISLVERMLIQHDCVSGVSLHFLDLGRHRAKIIRLPSAALFVPNA